MAQITIEGSKVTPTTFLKPGARITVERTRYIDNLLRRGYVNLIAVHEQADPQPVDEVPAPEPDPFGEPPESAAKSVWAEFLTTKGVEFPSGATKADMITAWNESQHGDAPSDD